MSGRASGLLLVLGLAAAGAACSQPEKVVVDKYFGAVKSQDNQTLSSFSSVHFDKPVDSWSITGSQGEEKTPAPLPELVKKQKEVESRLAEREKAWNAYKLDKFGELTQVQDARKGSGKVPAKLETVADEWDKATKEIRDLKKAVADAKNAVEREKRNVTLSVGQVENVDSLEGEMVTKKVDVSITHGGQSQDYVMTLRKYELKADTGSRIVSRWVVAGLQPKA
jgi:hypothetical protein